MKILWREVPVLNTSTGETNLVLAPSAENALLFEGWVVYGSDSNEMEIEVSDGKIKLGDLVILKGETL